MKYYSIFTIFLLSLAAQAQSVESTLINEINAERSRLGKVPCKLSKTHTKAAQLQAQWIKESGEYSHTQTKAVHGLPFAPRFWDRGKLAGCDDLFGENLAMDIGLNTTSKDSIEAGKSIYLGWHQSKGHNEIMIEYTPDLAEVTEGACNFGVFQKVGIHLEWCPKWNAYIAVMVVGGLTDEIGSSDQDIWKAARIAKSAKR